MALARHEVHLDPDAVRILEQHRVIARRPAAFLGRVHDGRAHLDQHAVQLVYVLAPARAEAEVMEAGTALVKAVAAQLSAL